MHHPGRGPGIAVAATLIGALTVLACSSGPTASTPGTPGARTPGPTVVGLDQLSLEPALETADPGPVGTPGELPPIGPPEGVPPPPPEVTVEYSGPADDLAGFVAAYREAFMVPELSDEAIGTAGARLCTYLQRQATPDGSVDRDRAVTEAEINEPGYPREAWLQAFEIATSHYCGEFSLAPGTEG